MGGQEGVGGLLASETTSPQGVIKPEETWGDKGRYPLINSENRGDVIYGWSLREGNRSLIIHTKNSLVLAALEYIV